MVLKTTTGMPASGLGKARAALLASPLLPTGGPGGQGFERPRLHQPSSADRTRSCNFHFFLAGEVPSGHRDPGAIDKKTLAAVYRSTRQNSPFDRFQKGAIVSL